MPQQYFDGLFLRHVGMGFDKQMRLADFLERSGGGDWYFDTPSARLSFGKIRFEAQILGSQDTVNNTWMWAWANEASKLPEQALAAAQALREFGEENQIEAFTKPLIPCDELFTPLLVEHAGHALATIAVGVLECDAYYAAPYGKGVAFLLLKDERLERNVDNALARIVSIFPQALNAYPIADHKLALGGYLEDFGFEPEAGDEGLSVSIDGIKV
ncbi:MAG: DUF6882 domain-containing protein, partial [Gemmataceae bacterium]